MAAVALWDDGNITLDKGADAPAEEMAALGAPGRLLAVERQAARADDPSGSLGPFFRQVFIGIFQRFAHLNVVRGELG